MKIDEMDDNLNNSINEIRTYSTNNILLNVKLNELNKQKIDNKDEYEKRINNIRDMKMKLKILLNKNKELNRLKNNTDDDNEAEKLYNEIMENAKLINELKENINKILIVAPINLSNDIKDIKGKITANKKAIRNLCNKMVQDIYQYMNNNDDME